MSQLSSSILAGIAIYARNEEDDPLFYSLCIGVVKIRHHFSIRKGHKYMTVAADLRTGRIMHAVEGRKEEDIAP